MAHSYKYPYQYGGTIKNKYCGEGNHTLNSDLITIEYIETFDGTSYTDNEIQKTRDFFIEFEEGD
jgi:hypothetical protein